MNFFYGVFGMMLCCFFDFVLVNVIIGFGKEMLLWICDVFECCGFVVFYGDIDSVFVVFGIDVNLVC